jgi:transposase-like protein
MSEKKVQKFYSEEFKRQAVELTIHSGRSIVQIGRELGVSEASLHFWRKRYGVLARSESPGRPRGAGSHFRSGFVSLGAVSAVSNWPRDRRRQSADRHDSSVEC